MIFIKHFDCSKQRLTGIGKLYVNKSSEVSDLVDMINERMGWSRETPLKLYEVFLIFLSFIQKR